MSFWTSPNLHPKTKSRFIVSFGTGFFLPNVKSVTKPSVEVATKEYRLMNHYFNYPGLVRWQPIKITFVDMNGAGGQFDTSQMLYEMLNKLWLCYIQQLEAHRQLGKKPEGGAAESHYLNYNPRKSINDCKLIWRWTIRKETNYKPDRAILRRQ